MGGNLKMMECQCHDGQETLKGRKAAIYLSQVSGIKFTLDQANKLLQFIDKSEVEGYLQHSCLILRTYAEYLQEKGTDAINELEIYENLHQFYWSKTETLEEYLKKLGKGTRGKTQDE